MTRRRAVLVCLLLIAGFATTGVASSATVQLSGTGPDGRPALAQADTTNATNNTTVRHRNPETYNRQGNTDALRQRLAEQLADKLQASMLNVSQGQYEAVNGTLGSEYSDLLSQYANVAGETDRDTQSATAFSETAETQREYTSAVARYRETYEAYQEARAAGDTARMRQLARKLDQLAARVNSTAATLNQTYRVIDNTTTAQTDTDTITNITTNITTTQRTISESLFVDTRIAVTASANQTSFADPLPLRGRVVMANGTPLANRSITLAIGSRTLQTTTNRSGAFVASYRPVLLSTGNRTVSVTYEPDSASVYRESTTNISVSVESINATLSLWDAPDSVRFAEHFTTSGTVRAAGHPVPGLPIAVTLGGVTVGTTQTDATGSFSVSETLPASVAAGEIHLTVEPAVSGRAITAANTSAPVRIRASDSSLSLTATLVDGTVNASGNLSANGVPLANRTVQLSVNGSVLTTARTDENGSYAVSFASTRPDRLRAMFDPEGNIRNAAASVQLEAATTGSRLALPVGWAWIGIALAFLVVGGGLYAVQNKLRRRSVIMDDPTGDASNGPNEESASESDLVAMAADRAATHRENGEFDAAVRAAYAAARARVDIDSDTVTHWEFYRTASLSGQANSALRELTAAYERAAFTPTGADEAVADTALDALDDIR